MTGQKRDPKGRFKVSGRDAGAILVALSVSLYLWLVHCLSYQYSVVFEMPVIAESAIEGHSFRSSESSAITARCRATGYTLLQLKRIARKPVVIKFNSKDLHHVEDDIYSISSNELVSYVPEIFGDETQLESFISGSVKFRFPVENCKAVPVQAVQSISFKPQYMALGNIQLRPDSVLVYGDPVRLESIDRVYTNQIVHSNLKSTAHGEIRLEPLGDLRFSADKVDYTIEVSRYVELSAEVKLGAKNIPAGRDLSIYPSTAKVTFRCTFPVGTDPLKTVDLYIDYSEFLNSRNGRCVPRVSSLPNCVIDFKVEPDVFECVENII